MTSNQILNLTWLLSVPLIHWVEAEPSLHSVASECIVTNVATIGFGFFSRFFVRRQKLDSTFDMTFDVIFVCDFKSSLQKYNFHYTLYLLNASLLIHQHFSAGYFSKSFCH